MFDDFGGSNRGDPRKNDLIINAASLRLFDMETHAVENVNVAAQRPEVIEMLKQDLTDAIVKGRSTAGPSLPSDHSDPNVDWPQLDVVKEHLE